MATTHEDEYRLSSGDEESIRLPDGSLVEEFDLPLSAPEELSRQRSNSELLPPGSTESLLSKYGSPVLPDEAAAECPPGGGGLIWHAELLSPEATMDCTPDGQVKPRRPMLPVRASDFFASLVRTEDGRWVFSGVLNGWPALTALELRSITTLKKGSLMKGAKVKRLWDAEKTPGATPCFPDGYTSVRATLRSPSWSAKGYAPGIPGFVWWFCAQRSTPCLVHGDAIVETLTKQAETTAEANAIAVKAHLFSHRYGRPKETRKDKLTYHSAILLEWDHGKYCTVVELATLNGIGGRRGKSNWFDDKMEDRPALYRHLPARMCSPWKGEFAEIRVSDVLAASLDEFKAYVAKYTDVPQARFIDAHFTHSSPVRLFHRSQADIARYLLNYMGRDRRYTEKVRNCQAFAADMFSFVAGKKGIEVFLPLLRPLYTPRTHLFLYDPEMYNNPVPSDELADESEDGAGGSSDKLADLN